MIVRLKFDHPFAYRDWMAEPSDTPGFLKATSAFRLLAVDGENKQKAVRYAHELTVHESQVEVIER